MQCTSKVRSNIIGGNIRFLHRGRNSYWILLQFSIIDEHFWVLQDRVSLFSKIFYYCTQKSHEWIPQSFPSPNIFVASRRNEFLGEISSFKDNRLNGTRFIKSDENQAKSGGDVLRYRISPTLIKFYELIRLFIRFQWKDMQLSFGATLSLRVIKLIHVW